MKNAIYLQDNFLNQIRKENMLSTVFLINGYQIKGIVRSFDSFTLLLEVDGKQQLVYKHAVSTIIPMRNVNLKQEEPEEITEQDIIKQDTEDRRIKEVKEEDAGVEEKEIEEKSSEDEIVTAD